MTDVSSCRLILVQKLFSHEYMIEERISARRNQSINVDFIVGTTDPCSWLIITGNTLVLMWTLIIREKPQTVMVSPPHHNWNHRWLH